MSDLNRYLTYKALHARYENHDLLSEHIHETLPMSNLCFKVTAELKSHLDRVATNMSFTRRELLTQALLHALDQADDIYELATHELVDTGVDIK